MATFVCRSCGHELPPYRRYDDTNWCEECVELALLDQSLEDSDRVTPEIFSV